MQELLAGARLTDRYALKKRLGGGGMSEVWLARDQRAGSDVALKFLNDGLAAKASARERLRAEWQVASRLMHAHIVRVFEYHDDDRPFFALQFVDGADLSDMAGESPDAFLPAIASIADALRYAHAKQVAHGDISAANIRIDRNGAPCLIDFGVANSAGRMPAATAPDRAAGAVARPADDVYALGVLLHELLTGSPPAESVDDLDSLSGPDGAPLPRSLSGLVLSMLAADPASRPSAEQVRDRLAAAGFPAGVARLPSRLRRIAGHETAETIRARARQAAPARAPAAAADRPGARQGIPARLVYGGLAASVLALIGVSLLLPDAVERTRSPVGSESSPDAAAEVSVEASEETQDGGLVDVAPGGGIDGGQAGFSENLGRTSADAGLRSKLAADEALGDLLSSHERLKTRGIERWGGQPYQDALAVYAQGDEAYINNNWSTATERYRRTLEMLDPFFSRIESEFRTAMEEAKAAFEREDPVEAVRLYDLAVAITPGQREAQAGLERARTLADVLDLMRQGRRYLDDLELEGARTAFENALRLDPLWSPAEEALEDVRAQILQSSFESRMTEGFNALAADDFATARAAFEAAATLYPDSTEPRDGLQQLDQSERLFRIRTMEAEASEQEAGEQWETAVATYEALLEVDSDLAFAQEGLARARGRAQLHRRLQDYIDDPDTLSDPVNMHNATQLMLGITRMQDVGPRLEDHKETLARLLKRAATPLTVELVSDNATQVSVYKIGRLGTFERRSLELRPGTYVAVGSRSGFRDVRREFRVAPEIDLEPIVVQCEEPI